MKKIAVLSLLITFASFSSFAQDGIKFEHDSWEAVVSKAKAENKLIFLDAYTSWCGPCKMLQKNVFPDQALGSYFNQNFLSTKSLHDSDCLIQYLMSFRFLRAQFSLNLRLVFS